MYTRCRGLRQPIVYCSRWVEFMSPWWVSIFREWRTPAKKTLIWWRVSVMNFSQWMNFNLHFPFRWCPYSYVLSANLGSLPRSQMTNMLTEMCWGWCVWASGIFAWATQRVVGENLFHKTQLGLQQQKPSNSWVNVACVFLYVFFIGPYLSSVAWGRFYFTLSNMIFSILPSEEARFSTLSLWSVSERFEVLEDLRILFSHHNPMHLAQIGKFNDSSLHLL